MNNETVIVIGAFAFTPSVKWLGGLASERLFAPNILGQSQASRSVDAYPLSGPQQFERSNRALVLVSKGSEFKVQVLRDIKMVSVFKYYFCISVLEVWQI